MFEIKIVIVGERSSILSNVVQGVGGDSYLGRSRLNLILQRKRV